MAEDNDIIARLKVEGQEKFKADLLASSKSADTVTASVTKMEAAIKEATDPKDIKRLTNELEAVKIASQAGEDSFISFRAELTKYKDEARGLGLVLSALKMEGKQNTQTFKDIETQFNLSKNSAAQLEKRIKDLDKELKSLGSDTRGIDLTVRSLGLLAGGFQVAEGGAALLGKNSEDLQKALIRLNGVMAVANGIQQVGNELTREDSIVKLAASKATQVYNLVVGSSTGALKAFRVALAATGIGLIVIALGALITNWKEITKWIGISEERLNSVGESFRNVKDGIVGFFEGIGDVIKSGLSGDFSGAYKAAKNIGNKIAENIQQGIAERGFDKTLESAIENSSVAKRLYQIRGDERNALVEDLKRTYAIALQESKKYNKDRNVENKKAYDEATLDYIASQQAIEDYDKEQREQAVADARKLSEEERERQERFNAQRMQFQEQRRDLEAKHQADITAEVRRASDERFNIERNSYQRMLDFRGDSIKARRDLEAQQAKSDIQKQESDNRDKEEIYQADIKSQQTVQDKRISDAQFAFETAVQFANLTKDILSVRTANELAALEDKKNRGLITEKQYQKEERRIKNEAAEKQRKADIALAVAKIPLIVLQAYASAPPPFSFILAGIAGALALAQVAILSAAPLPKFREGGSVAKRLGLIKGAKHEQGGVPIEVEGDEFVVKSQATKKYGVKMLDDINNLKFNPIISAGHKINAKRQNDMRLYENLSTISSYLKQGYKIDAKGNELLKEISQKMRNKSSYV